LLAEAAAPAAREERTWAGHWLARRFDRPLDDPRALLAELLEWLGGSESPLVVPWIEDLWLEERAVNLPGTPSSVRPNWQRPMRLLLDEVFSDADIDSLVRRLHHARTHRGQSPP
jgi:4-alpha-glucanotransferase